DDLVYGINIYDKPGEVVEPNQLIKKVVEQLDAYFTGENKVFSLPLSFEGYTSFQKSVWEQLAKIPFGEVASYGELAKRVNNPKGARAVGNACGKNPFSIVIPCHRAIGSSGQLGGFSSGLDNKRWLLKYEGITTKENKKK
ncbi:MAG: methylated-DNA--[protein]-cysteine S-methyltransferase, partial [Candidatus Cloacimonas sp.]|nr:methylated-DNA--[protein]-cysteine S-methyltransferase [Candidatus Cloacimonadota bacterium]